MSWCVCVCVRAHVCVHACIICSFVPFISYNFLQELVTARTTLVRSVRLTLVVVGVILLRTPD